MCEAREIGSSYKKCSSAVHSSNMNLKYTLKYEAAAVDFFLNLEVSVSDTAYLRRTDPTGSVP